MTVFKLAPVMYPFCWVRRYTMSNCLKVMKVVITAAGAIMARMPGTVIKRTFWKKPAPSSVALSYRLASTLCNAPSMVAIMKGSAIQRLSARQARKAVTVLSRMLYFGSPSAVSHWLSRPNSVLNIPTRHSRMDT